MLALLVEAPSALAVTPPCPASFATAINSAASGSTVTAPAGACTDNITVTNTNQFTIQAAAGGTTLEPTTASTPIIQSSANVRFTISGITFTGTNGASAIDLTGATEAVTLSGNTFTDNNATSTNGGAVLIAPTGTPTQPTVIEGNTFTGNSAEHGGGAVYLSGAAPFAVLGNQFTGNSSPDGLDHPGGGLLIAAFTTTPNAPPVTVSGNRFGGSAAGAGNTSGTAGGGAFIELAPGQPLTLDNNQFIDNAVTGSGVAEGPRVGGGLVVSIEVGTTTFSVNQAHNLFDGNVINSTEASGFTDVPAAGGGEWLFGVTDHSTDDVFTGNRVASSDGAPPEGGALGVQGQTTVSSTPPQPGVFIAANDSFRGNSAAAGGWGGAIYSGFIDPYCSSGCPGSTVALQDSTVVGNSVDAGAGSEGGAIWGSPGDTLAVSNSIIYGNTPTAEIFGYGSRTPTFADSDVCNESGGPPVSGPGLICANPQLNANGTETTGSPTVDAGSNALVAAGVTTDLAGSARIASSRVSCLGPGPAIVDMGAFEATFAEVPSCSAKVQIARGQLSDKHGKAKLRLSCPGGYLYCKGTVTVTTVKKFFAKGKHGKKGKAKRLKLGTTHFQIVTGGSATLTVKLSSKALAELASLGSVKISIAVSDQDARGDHASSSHKTKLKLPKPKHRKKHGK